MEKTLNNQNLSEICEIISKLNRPEDVEVFMEELFTPSERQDLIQRWNILKMLDENKPQRTISTELSVGLCKVTRGSKILKNEKSLIKKILVDKSWRK